MADKILNKIYVKVWRQNSAKAKGRFETYTVENISQGNSFLQLLSSRQGCMSLGLVRQLTVAEDGAAGGRLLEGRQIFKLTYGCHKLDETIGQVLDSGNMFSATP